MLLNEDRGEEQGLLEEAVITEVRSSGGKMLTRSEFSYQLANRIVNKGIRPLNQSAKHLEASPTTESFLATSIPAEIRISEEDRTRYDQAVQTLLERETRPHAVATAKITMDVKNAWENALVAVDAELGGAKAKPMSTAVKQKIADRLQLPITTVETAMKRIKRAMKHVLADEIAAKCRDN